MTFENILLVTAGTLTSLLAGVFFAYMVSVNGALHRLKDAEYVRAMQAINIVILNPLFFLSFMGPLVLLPWVTYLHLSDLTQFGLLLTATIVYIVGAFGITVGGNVPMNEKLAMVNAGSEHEATAGRTKFEKPWNSLHAARTVAAIIATVLIFAACVA